jgi:UDP-N-acetylglucosamine 1-carboxyvinyltransferase
MPKFKITGGKILNGEITISGRKNAALKLIAATILADKPVTLHRIPQIGDVLSMFAILELIGAKIISLGSESYKIDTRDISKGEIPIEWGPKLRSSLVLVGPLLVRFGSVTFPHPGGCVIGKRSILPHLQAFAQMGAVIEYDGGMYSIKVDPSSKTLHGTDIFLKEQSVTATENIIMAATRASGNTNIYSAAEEPHIINLCDLLRKMGFKISGDGTTHILIEGNPNLKTKEVEETTIADDIEIGTFAVAATSNGGEVVLKGVGTRLQLFPILSKLDDFAVNYHYDEDLEELHFLPGSKFQASNLQTRPWPGFPSDLQSPFTVLATQAVGISLIHDWMYEGRLYFVNSLQSMGANIIICDPHRAIVNGPTRLIHNSFITSDLRAGAAIVLATLIAEGTSIIEHIELIDRGYINLEKRLSALGADITRLD